VSAPRISVVVPTYRRPDALGRALDALVGQTVGPDAFEVLVVDDPVDDDSERVAADVAARPALRLRHLHRSAPGVSAARNAGWRAARAPLVMFIGDDVLGVPELLAEHLAWHERRGGPDVGVLGHVRWATELRTTPFMRWLDTGIQFSYGTIEGDEASWAHFYTSNISVPRALLEEIGGFDEERFPFLYEDLDVGYRLHQRGFRLLYNRRAIGEHLHPTTLADWKRRVAATAPAERRWVEHRPEMPAYFHDLFEEATRRRRRFGAARALLAHVSPDGSRIGRRAWASADVYYRQQLAPAYLAAWRASEGAAADGC